MKAPLGLNTDVVCEYHKICGQFSVQTARDRKCQVCSRQVCLAIFPQKNLKFHFFDGSSVTGKFKKNTCWQEPTRNLNASNIQKCTY